MIHAHESEDAFITRMQDILHHANRLKEVAAVSHSSIHSSFKTSHSPVTIDWINLPYPQPLQPSLIEAGLSHEIAAAANKLYQLRSNQLRQHVQESIVTACHKIAEFPTVASALSSDLLRRNVVSSFTGVYLRCLEQGKEEVIQRIKQAQKTHRDVVPKNSRTFNHEYVPLLEHFFEENPFPTHADKMFLAKKSNMDYKQIHVWFQNRRNRTKKEGKTSRKQSTSEGATRPLEKLYERTKGHTVGTDSQTPKPFKPFRSPLDGTSEIGSLICPTDTVADRNPQSNKSKDAFASSSPPHAFPSSYPPTCKYDPFPCKSGPISFGKPEWRRATCSKHPLSVSIGIDDLVKKFSQLNVRGDTRTKGSPVLQSPAATAAITVIPSHAPHPSLIIHKHPEVAHVAQQYPSVRASTLRLHAFQDPSPTSNPVTLIPLSAASYRSESSTKRKTAPLPQRFPGRQQNNKRDTTPSEYSPTSPSPCIFSASLKSRSCSLSSVSSSCSPTNVAFT